MSGYRLHALRQTGNLTRRGIPVHDTLVHTALYLRRGDLQSLPRLKRIALGDRRLNTLDESANAAGARPVGCRTPDGLPNAFFRRFMVSHRPFFISDFFARLITVSPPLSRVKPKA